MKTAVSLLCFLVVALDASAQAKKFKTLAELEASYDKDKLAALEAFVKDKAGKDEADLKAASAMIPSLKVTIAMKGTDGAALKEAHSKFVAELDGEDMQNINKAYQMTNTVADRMVDINDIAGAKAAWTALQGKFGDHPKAGAEIANITEKELATLEMIGNPPKPFKVKDMAEKDLSVEDYKGKVVLIDFWATWCGPCVAELPNVIKAYQKYHDKGFEIIGVSLDRDNKGVLDKFLADHPDMKWPQFYDGKFWKNELAVLYGVSSIPATFLIDKAGKVYRVGLRGKALDEAIEKLLADGGAKKG
jgi:thiol-disulfide isomerase/thioredoxin